VIVRLAQLVERYIDIVEVTGSSPVSDTKNKAPSRGFCFVCPIRETFECLLSGLESRSDAEGERDGVAENF
jgi:hypothetical protein